MNKPKKEEVEAALRALRDSSQPQLAGKITMEGYAQIAMWFAKLHELVGWAYSDENKTNMENGGDDNPPPP